MAQIQDVDNESFKMYAQKALQYAEKLSAQRVLVLGDVGLDEYLTGDVRRISPEAPVPVLEVKSEKFCAGLAANVAQNVSSLGGQVVLVGVVGADIAAERLIEILKAEKVKELELVTVADRPTIRKVRAISGQHHLVRIDHEVRKFISREHETKILNVLNRHIAKVSGLILQDYGKGLLTEELCQAAIELAHKAGKKVLVDPHRTTPVRFYRGADVIKPNRDEANILSGLNLDELHENKDSLVQVSNAILEHTKANDLVVTTGQDGVYIFNKKQAVKVPTIARQVYDVTGAGDTFLATLSLGWFSGLDLVEAAVMANAASGVVVGKVGAVPCSFSELKQALNLFTKHGLV